MFIFFSDNLAITDRLDEYKSKHTYELFSVVRKNFINMSSIRFESSWKKQEERDAIRSAREKVLAKAEEKGLREAERKRKEDSWMLPDLDRNFDSGHHKKEKKKKSKKRRHQSDSSSADSSDGTYDSNICLNLRYMSVAEN